MLCYKNGGLTRELIRNTHSSGSWATFNEQVLATPPGNSGRLGFYFSLKEIIPDGVIGDHLFVDGRRVQASEDDNALFPPEAHARAVLESQLLSIRSRLDSILPSSTSDHGGLKRCIITGGSSANPVIRQLAADVLGLPVYIASTGGGSAASGGALLAKYAWWKARREAAARVVKVPVLGEMLNGVTHSTLAAANADADLIDSPTLRKGTGTTFEDMRKANGGLAVDKVAEPHAESERVYVGLLDEYRRCEDMIVKGLPA